MSATTTIVSAIPQEPRSQKTAILTKGRLASLDAYRGFTILLMLTQLLALPRVAESFPDSSAWRIIGLHAEHAEWEGGVLIDLVQPSFSFLVGVALPFSVARRRTQGQSLSGMILHALWRSAMLVLLGVFLRSVGKPQTYWSFEDTLSMIGLGYTFLFLISLCRPWVYWAVLAAILVGHWAAFALYSTGSPDFSSHWAINANAGWAVDKWFLNLFPRQSPFHANRGGITTLNFIPTLGTMILGLIAGDWLRRPWPARKKVAWMVVVGLAGLTAGEALSRLGVCPRVFRIWTPSLVLFSGGWCFLFLAGFYLLIDVWQMRRWALPLVVFGMNAITMYCLEHLIADFIRGSFQTHFGESVFKLFGTAYEPILSGGAVMLVLWLIGLSMYRKKIFLRI